MAVLERFEFEDVEALRAGKFNLALNTACIIYRIGDAVIDTGPPNMWRRIKPFLAERDIQRLLITHHHEDHGGNAARIQKAWQTTVCAHHKAVPLLAQGFHVPLYRRLIWGKPKGKAETQAVGEKISWGNHRFKTIHVPGHAEDQICYLDEQNGRLYSGDLYISARPKFLRKEENPHLEISSLEKVLEHDFQTLMCAHRGIIPQGRDAVREKLDYLTSLRDQVRHFTKKGYSIGAITKKVLGRESFLTYYSCFDFSKRNYVEAFAQTEENT